MMKYLVVYDSIFGNTEKIALAVAETLAQGGDGRVMRAADVAAGDLAGLDLLAAGSPTRGFRPTPAMKDFLKQIPPAGLAGVKAAAFDTRMTVEDMRSGFLKFMVGIFGYAAQPIANQLAGKGARLVTAAEGFYVKGAEGPLLEGELERAQSWAKSLLAAG